MNPWFERYCKKINNYIQNSSKITNKSKRFGTFPFYSKIPTQTPLFAHISPIVGSFLRKRIYILNNNKSFKMANLGVI